MVIKKSKELHASTFNNHKFEVCTQDVFTHSMHTPRSVCDTERDRRLHRDPLNEEELE
jgi:hypothetical protein